MKAAIFYGAGKVKVEEVKKPKPGPHEAVVKVAYCGICGSDRHKYYHGWPFPLLPETKPKTTELKRLKYIPGHEVTGTIDELGSEVKGFKVGDKVAIYCIAYCGKCYYCQKGLSNYCLEFDKNIMSDHWDGGYAEYVKVPPKCLLKLPGDISTKLGNLSLDTLGCPYWMFEKLHINEDTSVAIYGCGPIGLATIKILGIRGIGKVYAIDIVDNKLALAKEFGAENIINASSVNPIVVFKERTDGMGTDVAIDTSGRPEAQVNAVKTPKKGGVVYIMGESPSLEIDISDFIHRNLTLMGGVYFPIQDYDKVLNILRAGKKSFEKVISHVFPLDKIDEAFKTFFEDNESIRVLIKP